MNLVDNEYRQLNETVKKIIGNKAWGVKIGQGSFITMEFGKPISDDSCSDIHGEWHLWVYFSSWRIEKNHYFLAGSQDSKDRMGDTVQQIEGSLLESFEIIYPSLDATLTFDNGIILRLFSVVSDYEGNEEGEHWMLYMPDKKVLVTGPGSNWIIEES